MVIQKTTVYKVLAIVLALFILVGSSERVEAAEDLTLPIVITKNGYTYTYTDKLEFGNHFIEFSHPVYVIVCRVPGGSNGNFLAVSKDDFNYRYSNIGSFGKAYANNIHLLEAYGTGYDNEFNVFVNENTDPGSLITRFKNYVLTGGDFEYEFFKPNWAATSSDPLFIINNMQADIIDGNIVVTWEPIQYLPFRMMENMYIRFGYANRSIGTATTTSGRNRYQDIESYAKMSDCGITIPISDLNIVENGYISSILATPYYYKEDNLDNETVKGKNTVIYFDELGVSSTPIIVEPEVEDEIPIENTEQNIFYSIQNFFSGFFRNLTNTIKSAVVPSGDDVMTLLQDMNDWFSERFGFIWYPFDLAIDIVGAFALGEPDSKITVPALTLNMFGGIKLWDEFQADLDPIGFLEYVRFFTSAIMCCGVAGLALNKWNEWIGGEH